MSKSLTPFLIAIFICGVPLRADTQSIETEASWVQGEEYRLITTVFQSDKINKHPILVVALHGDAPFNKPDYQNTFARKIAAKTENIVAVGLLRPGYTDPQGNTSEGERGKTNGDNWNARNTDSIADAIRELKRRYQSQKVIVAGHSGGAAITANIMGRSSKLIDSALLVSCPCDVKKWRKNMFELTTNKIFQKPIDTLSPIEHVKGISDQVDIVMIVGNEDEVAPPYLSENYREKALKSDKSIRLVRLENKGHEVFLNPKVFTELASMIYKLIDNTGT